VRVPTEIADEIVNHAREEAPNECCGMIGGRNGAATSLYQGRNAEASPLRYTIHPQDQLRIMDEIEHRGEELAAIYHSHTGSRAYPSQTDINLAENWPDPVYVICSVADPESPELRGFAIRDGKVEETSLDVE
jgi:[CysO sulfur-carrier protein]-S-L-cysteine hydrolase